MPWIRGEGGFAGAGVALVGHLLEAVDQLVEGLVVAGGGEGQGGVGVAEGGAGAGGGGGGEFG